MAARGRSRLISRLVVAIGVGLVALIETGAGILLGPPLAAQWTGRTQIGTLQQSAVLRQYRVYRATTREIQPALVLDLHGARTSGFLEEMATRFDAQAERRGWIVAYPDAYGDGWESYGCCDHPDVDDVA